MLTDDVTDIQIDVGLFLKAFVFTLLALQALCLCDGSGHISALFVGIQERCGQFV
jgi:hypothetical protein